MTKTTGATTQLSFPLDVEDDWPPFGVESLPFRAVHNGYEALSPPLFVQNLSVGDIIQISLEPGGERVESWHHVTKSGRTTVWLLRLRQPNTIDAVLAELRGLGCNTTGLGEAGAYAVDVPEAVGIANVDAILEQLDPDTVAVAFASMRHDDPAGSGDPGREADGA